MYFDLTVFPSLAGRANRLSNCSVVYPNHAGHVFPWALNAPFFNRRRNVDQLDSEFECLPGSDLLLSLMFIKSNYFDPLRM